MTKEQLFSLWRTQLEKAAEAGQKLATFHYLVLTNGADLEGERAEAFCEALGVPKNYDSEFRQMIALHRVMKKREAWIVKP